MFETCRARAAYKRFYASVSRAFPAEMRGDVEAVLAALTRASGVRGREVYEWDDMEFTLLGGETVRIPYRIYMASDEVDLAALTEGQVLLYHCLFTRHSDGYRRQAHLAALLAGEVPDWCLPFLLMEAGDYVREIVEELYSGLRGRDNTRMQAFCRLNLQAFLYLHSRMLNYWTAYYRYSPAWDPASGRWQEADTDYVGRRLFAECLGYSRWMEKERRRYWRRGE